MGGGTVLGQPGGERVPERVHQRSPVHPIVQPGVPERLSDQVLQAATAQGLELDVLTAVVLGGVSIAGGKGRLESVFVGVLIIGILANGMILLNIPHFYQLVIKGAVLLLAVGLDTLRQK